MVMAVGLVPPRPDRLLRLRLARILLAPFPFRRRSGRTTGKFQRFHF